MSRKRRMFDIEMPDEPAPGVPAGKVEPVPEAEPPRRGPMATAISETAESSRERARLEADIRAENDALAAEHVRLKRAGLITDLIPVDAIDTHKLIRDRAPGLEVEGEMHGDAALDALVCGWVEARRQWRLVSGGRRSN